MRRRVLTGLLALMILMVGSYGGYSFWTRRTPVTFAKGPAFGAVQSPSATPSATGSRSARIEPTPTTTSSTPARAATTDPEPSRAPVTPGGVLVRPPVNGTYTFDGSGTERVQTGGASPCSWEIKDVSMVMNDDGGMKVFDWTMSSQHQERVIVDYRPEGMFTVFAGAAVTCLGVRQTNQDDYKPPARRIAFPLKVGTKWTSTSKTGSRTEVIRGEILARENVSVPAGVFDAFRVRLRGTLSGGQEGTYEVNTWISPEVGLQVKQTAKIDAKQGSTSFNSDIRIELRSHP